MTLTGLQNTTCQVTGAPIGSGGDSVCPVLWLNLEY